MENLQKIKDNITVVIQGPIDERTYESIDSYSKQGFSEIICSCWEDSDLELLKKAKSNYRVVLSNYPKNLKEIKNQGCRYFIAQTTLKGAESAQKEFVLKTRSDEIYPDLSVFIDNFIKYPNKIHTTNNGFWKYIPFCFSNHLFLCNKELLIKTCSSITKNCENKTLKGININWPEQEFGAFFMHSMGHSVFTEDWKKLFKDNIFITPCSDLPNHLHSGASSNVNVKFTRAPNYPWGRPDNHNEDGLYNDINEL